MSDSYEDGESGMDGDFGDFALVLEGIGDGVTIATPENRIKYANSACEEIYGYTKTELIGKPAEIFAPPDEYPIDYNTVLASPGEKWEGEVTRVRKGGERFWIHLTMTLLRNSEHRMVGMVGVHRDIAGRKREDERLRESQERLRQLMDHAGDAIFTHDIEGRITDVNRCTCESLGFSRAELLDLYMGDIEPGLNGWNLPQLREQMSAGSPITFECAYRRKDGSTFPVENRVEMFERRGRVYFLVLARDISARRRLEERVRMAQRLEAVGRLTGGLTHDFNNMLTPIMTYAELADRSLPSASHLRGYVREISKAAHRASQLTHQMLSLSCRQAVESRVVNLNDLILDVDNMLRHLIREDIEMITLPDPDLGMVRVDPGQMEQVLINLVVNARDAMSNGGRLIVESANVTIHDDRAGLHDDVPAGSYVVMAVSDTGAGMTQEVQARIFEPFFSTKDEGTGLGPSTCHTLVAQVGGHVGVDSRPGQGATFTIYLPRVSEAATSPVPPEDWEHLPQGSETVLVVEDEPLVREVATRVLREQGYTVLEAANGHEALGVAGNHAAGGIDLLLTDVVMPLMSARELVERLQGLHPETKILYTSGYSHDALAGHQLPGQGAGFMRKPFTSGDLARSVREALEN